MKSIKFPKMFTGNSIRVVEDKKATTQNLITLLGSEKGELFGDPEFGLKLKRYTYEQNNFVLRDILIDEIYDQIKLFIPQLTVSRKDISITSNKEGKRGKLYVHIKGINNKDFTPNTFDLVLLNEDKE